MPASTKSRERERVELREMSWQASVYDHLLCEVEGNPGQHLSAAAIIGHDGSVRAQSTSFPNTGEATAEGPAEGTNNGVALAIRRPRGSDGLRFIAKGAGIGISDPLFRYSAPKEVKTFSSTCGSCHVSCKTRVFVTKIPDFQEVIVMESTCDACGHRNSELNANEIIPAMGKKVIVSVKNIRDLSRDVIKSDTASVFIPEVKLELASGSLGGLVTTVEGLITKISESLKRVGVYGFGFGGSLDDNRNIKWQDFPTKLMKLTSVEEPWTLVLDDALADSFVAPVTGNISEDHQLTFEEYERSWEQNEELEMRNWVKDKLRSTRDHGSRMRNWK